MERKRILKHTAIGALCLGLGIITEKLLDNSDPKCDYIAFKGSTRPHALHNVTSKSPPKTMKNPLDADIITCYREKGVSEVRTKMGEVVLFQGQPIFVQRKDGLLIITYKYQGVRNTDLYKDGNFWATIDAQNPTAINNVTEDGISYRYIGFDNGDLFFVNKFFDIKTGETTITRTYFNLNLF